MKQSLFITILLFFLFEIHSVNAQSYEWQRKWGTNLNTSVFAEDICMDDLGNTYTISKGDQTVNFSWSGNVNGIYVSGAITKTDPNGNLIWIKLLNGIGASCSPKSIVFKNGYLYLTGFFSGTIDFDPNNAQLLLSGNGKCFISKMNINGDCEWAQSFGSAGSVPKDLDVATNGDIAIIGEMLSPFTFAGQPLNYSQGADIFLVKYNTLGLEQWGQSFGSGSNTDEEGNSVKFFTDNSLVVSGSYSNTIDFNYGTTVNNLISNGSKDAFLLKLSNTGIYLEACTFGALSTDLGQAVTVDNQDNIIFTGMKYGNVDFNPSASVYFLNGSGSNAFICKLQSNFQFIWAIEFQSTSVSKGLSIICDNNNNIYSTGYAMGTIDFDPSPISNNLLVTNSGMSTFISKLNQNGGFVYAGLLNSLNSPFEVGTYNLYNEPTEICVSTSSIYISGTFRGNVDFNPDLNVTNAINSTMYFNGFVENAFILKLGQCSTTSSTQTINACTSYTWPVNNQTYNSNGVYTDTIANASGCDSMVTLNLTINAPTTNNTTVSSCNSYNWNGNIYNTSGVYNQVLSTSNGCDSTVTLNLTITNSPSAVVTSPDGITLNANVVPNATYQWIYCSDLTPVTNQTQSQFIPQINGLYAVVVTNNCGSDTSECANVNTIGLNELNDGEVQIAPNPTNGEIMILLNQLNEPIHLYIRDMQGRILMGDELFSLEKTIDLHHFSSGTYFITLEGFGVYQVVKN
ncbi:MAG: hypothetical protein RL207_308 [Bacteroidota bacterium]|jgi:hypothetical protein